MQNELRKDVSTLTNSLLYLRTDENGHTGKENGHVGREKAALAAPVREPSPGKRALSHSPPAEEKDQRVAAKAPRPSVIELGYVNYDGAARDNASCSIVVPAERGKHFRRDIYVGIRDREQGLEFLGRLVAGPFHTPSQSSTASADARDKANYHVHGTVEIIGQLTEDDRVVPTATRPRPHAEIYIFPDHRLQQFLGINGDFYLGHLSGHSNAKVHAQSTNTNFLPRNVGIFGTVGSGKSNTAQVLIEEALEAGWAVVLIDVEGEYVRMNEPTDEPRLLETLDREHQLPPKGVNDLRVYVPSSGRSAARSSIPFKVPISALYPEVVADILAFTEAEIRVFGMVTTQAERFHATDAPEPVSQPECPLTLQ